MSGNSSTWLTIFAFVIPIYNGILLAYFYPLFGECYPRLSMAASSLLLVDLGCATYWAFEYFADDRFKKLKIIVLFGTLFSQGYLIVDLHFRRPQVGDGTWSSGYLPLGLYLCVFAITHFVQTLAILFDENYLKKVRETANLNLNDRRIVAFVITVVPILEFCVEKHAFSTLKDRPTITFAALAMFVTVYIATLVMLYLTRKESNSDSFFFVCLTVLWWLSMLVAQIILVNPISTVSMAVAWIIFEHYFTVHFVDAVVV